MIINDPTLLPEDAAMGVRAVLCSKSGIRATFCPADYLRTYLSEHLHGHVPSAYALIGSRPDGTPKIREGETVNTCGRMRDEHLPAFGGAPWFHSVLWFSGEKIGKDMAEGLQYIMSEVLVANGCGMKPYPTAHRPRELVWPVVEHLFTSVQALTRALGFSFFDAPPPLYLAREISEPPLADKVWDYDGGYVTAAAHINGALYLLRHSEIRERVAPSVRSNHMALRESLKLRNKLDRGPRGALVTLVDLPFPSLDAMGKFVRADLSGSKHLWVPRPKRLDL